MNGITIRTKGGVTVVTVNGMIVVFQALQDAWEFIKNVTRLILIRRLLGERVSYGWLQARRREMYGEGGTAPAAERAAR